MANWIRLVFVILLCVPLTACGNQKSGPADAKPQPFNPETLTVPDQGGKKIRGQVLYMPIYSNIPMDKKNKYDVSAFLAVHNTDLKYRIKIKRIDYFDTEGRIVKNFITADQQLDPVATKIFTIPKEDQSGTGANFLIEWIADQPVNEPLIESIMTDLTGTKGLAFISPGKIIREIK
ncbi:MAG: DUF3124 domain-containing protein [Syntrophaceae bacterium]